MSIKTNYECLMIETSNNTKVFTHKKNYPQIIELSRAIGAEVSVVEIEKAEVLEIKEIAPFLCVRQKDLGNEGTSYKVISIKIPKPGKKIAPTGKDRVLQISSRVKTYIEAEFLVGNEVSLAKIKNKFKNFNLVGPTISNHLRTVRKSLEKKGHKIDKTGTGRYTIM